MQRLTLALRPLALVAAMGLFFGCSSDDGVAPQADPEPWLDDPTDTLPPLLSDVGLYADLAADAAADRVVAYDVRYPLYSDGNAKARFAHFPDGVVVDTSDPRAWEMPVGSSFFKTFYHQSDAQDDATRRRVETRILHKRADGWDVGTYVWNDAGTEAELWDGTRADFDFPTTEGTYRYTVPSRSDCLACHQAAPDFVAGFEAAQLVDVDSGRTQLDELEARGLFSDDVATAEPSGSSAAQAALGYLHTNCSHCHNPTSSVYVLTPMDLRYWNATESTVDVTPRLFFSGDPDVRLVSPQDPEASALYRVVAAPRTGERASMPPVGTSIIDDAGLATLRAWIETLENE